MLNGDAVNYADFQRMGGAALLDLFNLTMLFSQLHMAVAGACRSRTVQIAEAWL